PWQPAIFGVLTDAGGNPLAGATVTVELPSGWSRTTITDTAGRYELSVPRQGMYEIQASLSGMAEIHTTTTVGDEGGALTLALNVPPLLEQLPVWKNPYTIDLAQYARLTPLVDRTSVNGASNPLNTYTIDGADASDSFFG